MENKLEQLLNSLIEKGWKPFGNKPLTELKKNVKIEKYNRKIMAVIIKNGRKYADDYYSLRDLVSKESGLWQFVCKNGMIKKEGNSEWTIIYPNERTGDYQKCHSYCKGQSEYWILESSLKDESELEDFLLNSIKLD